MRTSGSLRVCEGCLIRNILLTFYFLNVYLFIFRETERERERKRDERAEREGRIESQAGPHYLCGARRGARSHES